MNIDTDTRRYFNATYVNNNSLFVPAEFNETRTSPILNKPSEWNMSVIRFDIDTSLIPINLPIMEIDDITMKPSKTITDSVITIKLNSRASASEPIILSIDDYQPYPFLPTVIFNYDDWLGPVNNALAIAFTDLGLTGFSPFFHYDPTTQLISLFVDNNFIGPTKATIFLDAQLQKYFTNFDYTILIPEDRDVTDEFIFRLEIDSDYDILLKNGDPRDGYPGIIQNFHGDLYQVIQTAQGIDTWNSLRSIILTSSSLPFRTEFIPAKPTSPSNYLSSSTFPILIDHLVPQKDNPATDRDIVEFLPTAQFSYIDLVGQFPMNSIDFKFYWSDFLGNIYPMFLGLNGGLSIKILFEKKNLQKTK